MTATVTIDTPSTTDDRQLLLRMVEEAYRQSTWNGTNLRASLKHLTTEQADWRPPHARYNIAEIVLHSAYWKFAIRKRLTGDRKATFALKGISGTAVGGGGASSSLRDAQSEAAVCRIMLPAKSRRRPGIPMARLVARSEISKSENCVIT